MDVGGDASMRTLALAQDPVMAELKTESKSQRILSGPSTGRPTVRGRDDYEAYGVLRTKPGRADSQPSISMSCSDKIASWTLLGAQGALLGQLLDPVYIDGLIFGDVDPAVREVVAAECHRAFISRLHAPNSLDLPSSFKQHEPELHFTSEPFPHSRSEVEKHTGLGAPVAASESISFVNSSDPPVEALVNRIKRGASLKGKGARHAM
ncbi:hypothetical protein FRB99_002643 [Tulasnella sp. 403]|nr:hypothetical protein FRB99_002643 [Tulasnella sp. 403]